jgi:hypothetical protein
MGAHSSEQQLGSFSSQQLGTLLPEEQQEGVSVLSWTCEVGAGASGRVEKAPLQAAPATASEATITRAANTLVSTGTSFGSRRMGKA